MDFASDNATGASPRILQAIFDANDGSTPAYGADAWTQRAETMLRDVFERDCAVFLVATGTGANALALASLSPPWGAIFCHENAHVIDDECGAPEFYSAGAKLVGIEGPAGKIDASGLEETLRRYPRGLVKQVQPAALSLSQGSECGTVYDCDELARLCAIAHAADVGVHMDGARFANALVHLGCSPAEMTWKAGIDVVSFGATKNGALACEAVIFFDPGKAADFAYRRKRGAHTLSKGRLLGAQMCAYLEGDHWLDLARTANRAAARLASGLRAVPGVRLPIPQQINQLFPVIPRRADAPLKAAGARYYDWGARGLVEAERPRADEMLIRLVTSFATSGADIDRFVDIVASA